MRKALTLQIVGVVLVTVALSLIYFPLGVLFCGAAVLAFGVLTEAAINNSEEDNEDATA